MSDDSLAGSYYEFDAAARRLTTSQHMSAAESDVDVYEWNGHCFGRVRHIRTNSLKPGGPNWRDFFPEAAGQSTDD